MPRDNDASTEYIGRFTLDVYHAHEPLRYVVVIPELDAKFTSTTLANATANSLQGLLFHLFEKQKRVEMLHPRPHV